MAISKTPKLLRLYLHIIADRNKLAGRYVSHYTSSSPRYIVMVARVRPTFSALLTKLSGEYKFHLSFFVTIPLKPLVPSPGKPNITSTPQSSSDSAAMPAVLVLCSFTMRYDMRRQDMEVITCWKYSQLDFDDFIYTFCKLDVIVADSIDIMRN